MAFIEGLGTWVVVLVAYFAIEVAFLTIFRKSATLGFVMSLGYFVSALLVWD
jgi:hypothetical protein